jgi:hypothetical protein
VRRAFSHRAGRFFYVQREEGQLTLAFFMGDLH